MDRSELICYAAEFIMDAECNYISREEAISDEVCGLKLFDEPIFACGDSEDILYDTFKKSAVLGEGFMKPGEWLSEAKTVISFFLPFTEEVKSGNRLSREWPSAGWLHGRIEGQAVVGKLCEFLKSKIESSGCKCVIPALDDRFKIQRVREYPEKLFVSNWSERHAAYVCGLGTFSLSKALITSKGMAGRLGSIITDLYLEADVRAYSKITEYCIMCGACVKKCPVNAIAHEREKNNLLCSGFLDKTKFRFSPRYACGMCQVGVPCESRIPHSVMEK